MTIAASRLTAGLGVAIRCPRELARRMGHGGGRGYAGSAAVAQSGGQAVDRQVDRPAGALVRLPCAIAAQQLDLQVVERIEVREAVANGALERRIVLEQAVLARDGEHEGDGARVLV